MRTLRPLTVFLALGVALAAPGPAVAAPGADGFYVFKDALTHSVVEYRDAATGRVLRSTVDRRGPDHADACSDPHKSTVGATWRPFEPYAVNRDSAPSYLDAEQALTDVVLGHAAWASPLATDCAGTPGRSSYRALFGGTTASEPSLAWLEFDGENTVGFLPLAGTVCDGPGVVACVVGASDRKRFVEGDMLIEADLAGRLGADYRWTTGDRTWAGDGFGELALLDVVTHEWGHFAGLGHVNGSPELTMFPSVHDGMETLGRGDMKGVVGLYPAR